MKNNTNNINKDRPARFRLKANGYWKITSDSIRIVTDFDFCKYYCWLFMRGTYNIHKMQLPKHFAHIGVINPKFYKDIDCKQFMHLDGKRVDFYYDNEGNYGGFTKGFRNFWFDTWCDEANAILDFFGIPEQRHFCRTHLTICNNKNLTLDKNKKTN